jgi:hypothetical protein
MIVNRLTIFKNLRKYKEKTGKNLNKLFLNVLKLVETMSGKDLNVVLKF